jgi:diacylglycerol kinase (ATP)
LIFRRVVVVVNPASRRGAALVTPVREAMRRAGVACDVVLTERAGQAAELARTLAPQYDAVFTLGGDGTAMEVVGALARSGTPVGILAGGTGNQLVRALGIPLNVTRAVNALLGGTTRTIDLGRLQSGRLFALALGIGPDVAMSAETSAGAKRRFGVLAYMVVGIRAILRLERFRATITVDGERHEREVTAIMIANLPGVEDGRITFGPGIAPDDGRLNVSLWLWPSALAAVGTFWRSATGRIAADPSAEFFSGCDIRVDTTPAREAEADGELVGHAPLMATVESLAATLLVPAR